MGLKQSMQNVIIVGRSLVFSVPFFLSLHKFLSGGRAPAPTLTQVTSILSCVPFLFFSFSSSCHCPVSLKNTDSRSPTQVTRPIPAKNRSFSFYFFIFKEPSNLFLRMPIFKIFILTNLLIIPAIVAGVHFKTGQLLAPFSCTLKEEYKQIWTMYFQKKKKMKVAHSIKNLCTARVCIGKYILSILLKNKSRHWITEDNQGIGIKQEIDWYKKLWDEAINSKFKL